MGELTISEKDSKKCVCVCVCVCVLFTSQSVWDGAGVLTQVVLVEALRVALPEQPGDLLLQHLPHCLRQVCILTHYTNAHTQKQTHNKGPHIML